MAALRVAEHQKMRTTVHLSTILHYEDPNGLIKDLPADHYKVGANIDFVIGVFINGLLHPFVALKMDNYERVIIRREDDENVPISRQDALNGLFYKPLASGKIVSILKAVRHSDKFEQENVNKKKG